MAKERASIFGETGEMLELDVKHFGVKHRTDPKAPPPEQVRAVAEAVNFPSRESKPATPKPSKKREARVYRTGRNVQFNVKASQETVDAIYAITDAHPGWVLGYTLERAVAALKRELEAES